MMKSIRTADATCEVGVLFENKEFLERLENDQKPVLIRGGVAHWSALAKWSGETGIQSLGRRVGDAPVQVMCSTDTVFFGAIGKHKLMRCKMGEFLDEEMQKKWKEMNLYTYLAQARIDEGGPLVGLMEDVEIPQSFCDNKANFQVNLWMSLKSESRSSPHFDPYENLLCLITGKKTAKLYPGSLTRNFYPYPAWSESHNHSTVNFAVPDLNQHPKYKDALDQECTVSMEAGDVLYIPEGWWHQIDSLSKHAVLKCQIHLAVGGTTALNLWWTSRQSHAMANASNRGFHLRQLLKQMTTEEVENIVNQIEPWAPKSSPIDPTFDEESQRPTKKHRTSVESPFTLSITEKQRVKDLIHVLEAEEMCDMQEFWDWLCDGVTRWLNAFPSLSVCRMLYNLSTEHKDASEQFWNSGLHPLACHLLTEHFQAIHTDPTTPESFKESFFEMLYEAIPDHEKVLEKINKGTESVLQYAYQTVLEQHNLMEASL